MKALLFPNGNIGFFDDNGEQVPKAQKPYITLYFEYLESIGINPEKVTFMMPTGTEAKALRIANGWNWEFI